VIKQPEDKGILLKDILQDKFEERYYIDQAKVQNTDTKQSNFLKKILLNINPSGKGMNGNVYNPEHKSPTLTTNKGE
jgi:modification methylase SPRI